MISPDYATTLCFVETDAAFEQPAFDRIVREATARSFERITVDGQLSTSDSLFAIASGRSGRAIDQGSESERVFAAALEALFRQLALEIVADGEGSTRVARLTVRGPGDAVEPVARAIGNSPLVKCALYGADANWGRILQAAGQALAGGSAEMDLAIEGVPLVKDGDDLPLSDGERKRLDESMREAEIEMELDLVGGDAATKAATKGDAELFFCDLGHDYVSFNSEYTT
jgi:glutamate N-acetyltransferase/amino-acid N-acetyltransferase